MAYTKAVSERDGGVGGSDGDVSMSQAMEGEEKVVAPDDDGDYTFPGFEHGFGSDIELGGSDVEYEQGEGGVTSAGGARSADKFVVAQEVKDDVDFGLDELSFGDDDDDVSTDV